MNRFRVWGLSAALVAGVGGQAVASDPNMQPGQTTLVQKIADFKLTDVFGTHPQKPLGPSPTAPLTINAPPTPEVLDQALRAEQAAYFRRVSVCDELRKVADAKGDVALSQQADELERRAEALYNARVAALGLPKSKASPSESTRLVSLQDPPAPKAAANRLIAPVSPVPSESTAEVHEVKP